MAIDPELLERVLGTPESRDVTKSPIVRALILSDAANAADLVPALEQGEALAASNARRILCLFGPSSVPHLLGALHAAGPNARMEGLEVLWAWLVAEEAWTVREALSAGEEELKRLLDDPRPLPGDVPEYVERDFRGRICDLAYIVVQELINRDFDQSTFRSLDDDDRDEEIRRLKSGGFGLRLV